MVLLKLTLLESETFTLIHLGLVAKFQCSAWLGVPRAARRIETTRRHHIADVRILYARKVVCDVCYLLFNINYFYSNK